MAWSYALVDVVCGSLWMAQHKNATNNPTGFNSQRALAAVTAQSNLYGPISEPARNRNHLDYKADRHRMPCRSRAVIATAVNLTKNWMVNCIFGRRNLGLA
jgi:hypothetical protein